MSIKSNLALFEKPTESKSTQLYMGEGESTDEEVEEPMAISSESESDTDMVVEVNS